MGKNQNDHIYKECTSKTSTIAEGNGIARIFIEIDLLATVSVTQSANLFVPSSFSDITIVSLKPTIGLDALTLTFAYFSSKSLMHLTVKHKVMLSWLNSCFIGHYVCMIYLAK